VKVLVHGAVVERASRLGLAAAGLALRGHEVAWAGGTPPAGLPSRILGVVPGGVAIARHHAEMVISEGRAALAAAASGWLARAHAMVLGFDAATLRRWGWGLRFAWGSLPCFGLVDAAAAEALQAEPPAAPLDRLAAWSAEAPPPFPAAEHADTEILERACERVLARHRSAGLRGAVFADRDGTLIVERGYLSDPADLEVLPGVPEAIHALHAAGFAVVVISNQSGVGRGFFTPGRVYEAMAALRRILRARGAELDAIYFCPHRPDEGCACRKPGTLLLERAAENLGLALARSAFVGDKRIDVRTGHNAGALGVLVRTGYGGSEPEPPDPGERPPDQVCESFAAAVEWLLGVAGLERHA